MLEYEKYDISDGMIFQMESMLISQINQKNVCSVAIGIF